MPTPAMPSAAQAVENLELACVTGGHAKWQSLWKTVWLFLKIKRTLTK